MMKIVYIAIGGALGALLRYWVSGLVYRFTSGTFPWGTLVVNLSGSFLIGLLWGMFETTTVPQNIRLFLFIGILGSFTTFSTFSLENFHLLRDGEYMLAGINIAASLILGITLAVCGFFLSRSVLHIIR
ncbi:MAG: fluoride efflux transporter CrcB [Candidatus Omnitrophica bacterium]|nr:fluoride efflux transporter CrcB [Candidatus Omnitrophota bacterium]